MVPESGARHSDAERAVVTPDHQSLDAVGEENAGMRTGERKMLGNGGRSVKMSRQSVHRRLWRHSSEKNGAAAGAAPFRSPTFSSEVVVGSKNELPIHAVAFVIDIICRQIHFELASDCQ